MRFDLVDLRLFLHVAEAGSITAGAKRAGLALASASARVRGMEQALGTVLLERGRRGIGLTPAGRSVAHHARAVLAQVERMRGDLAEHAQGLRGRVRLLSNTAALTELLPDALAPWLAANPGVDTRGPAPRLSGRCGRVLRTPELLRTGWTTRGWRPSRSARTGSCWSWRAATRLPRGGRSPFAT